MGDLRSAKSREADVMAKREEQLRNFEKSAMYYQTIREHLARTIKFDWASMFHAACAAGDREEVRHLLADPDDADVNCLNMDGLSALHQAAIDNNLDMVKFLVELGADINVEDRECWTPLHATVNCGHNTIAKFLLDRGADLAAVNCDGNLPIDIAESDEMKALIQEAVSEQGIDCDLARKREERDMTGDSIYWAIEAHALCQPHPNACKADTKTGSTALHVAAAKGYIQVMRLLIKCCKVDVNAQDIDGWTPLHAAAYWCQKNALKILLSSGADGSLENNKGETYLDLTNVEMEEFVKAIECEPNNKHSARLLRGPFDFRYSKNRDKNAYKKGKSCGQMCEVARIDKEIEMLDKAEKWASDQSSEMEACMGDPDTGRTLLHEAAAKGYAKVIEVLVTRCYLDVDAQDCEGWTPLHLAAFHEQIEAVSYLISWGASTDIKNKRGDTCVDVSTRVMENHIYWMKMKMHRRGAPSEMELEIARKRQELKNKIMNCVNSANSRLAEKQNDAIDREPEEKPEPVSVQLETAVVLKSVEREKPENQESKEAIVIKEAETAITAPMEREPVAVADISADPVPKLHENMISSDDEPKANKSSNAVENDKGSATAVGNQPKLSPGNIFKNFFKSFVPPARDEESATQRKAHAKRIRETRRSTQGISLEEIQNAELLIRKNAAAANNSAQNTEVAEKASEETAATTIAPKTQKFALEDASKADTDKQHANNIVGNSVEVADTVTIPLRRPPTSAPEEKPSLEWHRPQSAKYDSAVPKNNIRRRSTGISQKINDQNDESVKKEDPVDYKKLYEISQLEVERLYKIIKSYEEQSNSKGYIDKVNLSDNSEEEKREKRALQRKLSEMEEELLLQNALQTENQRLKTENGALIRVISKLSAEQHRQ